MNGLLEQNVLDELEKLKENLKPTASVIFTTVMCDCTGWCYGNCEGDCQGYCSGNKNVDYD